MKSKRLITLVHFFILIVSFLFINSASAQTFRIITEEFPPYNFTQDGKIVGISTEIVRELLKRIGHPDNMEVMPWARGYKLVQEEDNIILFSTTRSPVREKLFKWVGPLVPNNSVFFARKGSGISITSLEDAKKVKSIGIYKDDFGELLLKEKGFVNLDTVLENQMNVQKLPDGEIDLWIANELTGKHLAGKEGFGGKIEKVYDVQKDFMYLAFSKSTPDAVIDKWQTVLEGMKSDGTYSQIFSSWIMFSYVSDKKSDSLELTGQEKAWLKEHPVLRLGVDPAFMPFEFIDDKKNYSGMAADFVAILGQRLGVKMEVQPNLSWTQVIEGVKKLEIDLLPVVAQTEKRQEFLNFTQPYLTFPTVIMTKINHPYVKDVGDFSGKRLAMVKGYYYVDAIRSKHPDIKQLLVETPLDALKAVSFGKADGVVVNYAVAAHLVLNNNLLNLKVASKTHIDIGAFSFGVRKDWPELAQILDKALRSISQEQKDAIRKKWIPIDIKQASEKQTSGKGMIKWLIAISIVIFLLLAGFAFFLLKSFKEESVAQWFGTRRFRILILAVLSIFITVVAFLSWLSLNNIKGKILKRTQTELEIVLKSTAQRLNNWLDSQKSFMDQLGRDPELLDITERLLAVPHDRDTLLSSTALREVRDFFQFNQDRFGKAGFFIISPDRISIGSMRDNNTGTRNLIAERQPKLIEQVFNGTAVFIPPIRSDVALSNVYDKQNTKKRTPPTMFFAAPIRKPDGTVIAVLTQRLLPEQEFSRELHFGRIGETGETYAFDRNGLLLSDSRFNDHLRKIGLIKQGEHSILNVEIRDPGGNMVKGYRPKTALQVRPFTRMVASAIRGESGTDVDGYRDYRGVPVYGSWQWIESLGFGLTTEIDVKEALSTFNTMRLTTFSILGITLFLTIGATLFTLALGERATLSLAKARDKLEQRVKERTVELSKTLEISEGLHMEADFAKAEAERFANEAKQATRAKSDFLANMSHEIRTPMNAIIGMSYLALQTELNPKQLDYMKKIDGSAKSLLQIINDILDFSKIEAGKMDMESVNFDLEESLSNVANMITVKAHEKGLEIVFAINKDVPVLLVGDPLRVGQVLINLANNAVKFTESGEIVVKAELVEQTPENAKVKFSVKDTGIGLTEDQISKLFKSFSQADASTTRKFGGTGLGLTISKRLVEMMEGEIWVESEYGKGSTFFFTSKFGIHKEGRKRELVPSVDLRGMYVLVVDDNQTSREVLQNILEALTFKVELVASGKEAITELENAARQNPPFDLVLMDWKMPEMDGIEATRLIRENQNLAKVPTVIMVTAYGREEIMSQAEKVDIKGFLVKPVNKSLLFNTIMNVFGKGADLKAKPMGKQAHEMEDVRKIVGARVLLTEDNEINQQVAKELLQQAGLVVDIANNGKEAVEKVKETEYDVVLMDIQMPVMDGYTATREIRKLKEEIRNIPIIAMTANVMAQDIEECKNAGMNDHVAKPINPSQLFNALVKWIGPKGRKISDPRKQNISDSRFQIPDLKTEKSEIPPLSGIDTEAGIKRVGGNKKLYRTLLLKFKTGYTEATRDIKKALKDGEFKDAERFAHTIKGVAGNIGAEDLYKAAGDLESVIKNEDQAKYEENLNNFSNTLNLILESLKRVKAEEDKAVLSAQEGPDASNEVLLATLKKLESPLSKRKPKDCKAGMEEILKLCWPKELQEDVNKINGLINKYKFKEAKEGFNKIIKKLET